MLELALRGGHRYWIWVFTLITLTGGAPAMFVLQMTEGLTVTAMSRDMPWGFYIAQLTFLVGVAASAVVVVLPYYLHDVREFGKLISECSYISQVHPPGRTLCDHRCR